MGVQGLSSLLNQHGSIFTDVKFRSRSLVIDGCNLLYLLYFKSGLDQNRGGEYAAFEKEVERFVSVLRDCDITAYVVLDGGSDPSDKKLQTSLERNEDRIRRAVHVASEDKWANLVPIFAQRVLKQTLTRLNIPFAQCYAEADEEIAALANAFQCPVLSNDSDFFIFNLRAGLLPITHFMWKEPKHSHSGSYISCKRYSASSFCVHFNIRPQLLPTFATLAGNDYFKMQGEACPVRWAEFDPADTPTPRRLAGLLNWLSLKRFQTSQEALEAALGLMGNLTRQKRAELLQGMSRVVEGYRVPASYLKKFFIHGTAPPFPEPMAALVPEWMWLPLTQARLTPTVLDLLQMRRMNQWVHVDHIDSISANLMSRPLRQVMYGLLLGPGTGDQVTERDREGDHTKFTMVKPDCRVHLKLQTLNQVALSERLQVLTDALSLREVSLDSLPPELRLPVAVTCFWLQRAEPRPDDTLLKALLLWMSTADLMRDRASAAATQERKKGWKPKLDLNVVHAYNQWQSCLRDSIYLNQLLQHPLPEPPIARLYEGTLLHQLVHTLRTGGKTKAFLKRNASNRSLYCSMRTIVHSHQETSRREQEQQQEQEQEQQHEDQLIPHLSRLFVRCEDEDIEEKSTAGVQEEEHLNELVTVKSRYRKKDRTNRCQDPQVARKQECRGRANF